MKKFSGTLKKNKNFYSSKTTCLTKRVHQNEVFLIIKVPCNILTSYTGVHFSVDKTEALHKQSSLQISSGSSPIVGAAPSPSSSSSSASSSPSSSLSSSSSSLSTHARVFWATVEGIFRAAPWSGCPVSSSKLLPNSLDISVVTSVLVLASQETLLLSR